MDYTEDIFSALDIQDDLQTLYTSGTVFHAFLGEKLPDWKAAASLVRKIARTTNCRTTRCPRRILFVRTTAISPASILHVRSVEKRTEVYSRITGYYRPVKNWNDGKRQEYKTTELYMISSTPNRRAENEIVRRSRENWQSRQLEKKGRKPLQQQIKSRKTACTCSRQAPARTAKWQRNARRGAV